jgi:hypothetical protein
MAKQVLHMSDIGKNKSSLTDPELIQVAQPLVSAYKDTEHCSAFLEGYIGIGDNFWQRPYIKEVCKRREMLYLQTYTPQAYWDIKNIRFVKPNYPAFKSHIKGANKLPEDTWVQKPSGLFEIEKPLYWSGFHMGITLQKLFELQWNMKCDDFSFPVKDEWIGMAAKRINSFRVGGKKICIIHFPTIRNEWKCPARDPKPEYMQMLVDRYKDKYYFISLADLDSETFTQAPKGMDKEFHHGELTLREIMGMIKLVDLVICGNCYLLPMTLAIGTKVFALYGGCQKPELFLDMNINPDKYAQVTPEPFCNCLDSNHECNKEISEELINLNFDAFVNVKKSKKKKILVHKVGNRYHSALRSNLRSRQKYDYVFENDIPDLKNVIRKSHINTLITTQYPPSETDKIKVNRIFCEAFLGSDNVFDRVGFHYMPDNEIKRYAPKIKLTGNFIIPQETKMEQPDDISWDAFIKKYGLSKSDKYIVLMGQEMGDKSLIYSKNPDVQTYTDYIHRLAMDNLDVKFIFKPHPVYLTFKKHLAKDIAFIYNYRNIVPVYEGINTLFNLFDKFTAFSSTTILEGLMREKKFATLGHHFCSEDGLVLQLTSKDMFKGLYDRLEEFKIDGALRMRYLEFLINYYAIRLDSEKLIERVEKSSDEYFLGGQNA